MTRPRKWSDPPPPPDPGNPDPERIRRWHIPNPYGKPPLEQCYHCDVIIEFGELVNIEYEVGVVHAACSDGEDPAPGSAGSSPG